MLQTKSFEGGHFCAFLSQHRVIYHVFGGERRNGIVKMPLVEGVNMNMNVNKRTNISLFCIRKCFDATNGASMFF